MTQYTVEVTTAPVDDWGVLRAVLEAVPGSFLIEDPEFPELVIPVDAESPMKAATFVDGLSQVIGFKPLRGQVYETPAVDFDVPEGELSEPAVTTVGVAVTNWIDAIPPVPRGRGRHKLARV